MTFQTMDNTIWIVLASVFGVLVLALIATLLLFCRKRSKKKVRIFSLRAVTPLDDAEFESWRRPSTYTSRPEKYGIMPSRPAVVRAKNSANLFEKEIALYNTPHTPPQTPPKSATTVSAVKVPDHARRKSSLSIHDRPPTPFSPDMSGDSDPALWLPKLESPRSRGHVHYPSVSEASEFDFGFSSPPQHSDRFSNQSERRLYTRARQHSMT